MTYYETIILCLVWGICGFTSGYLKQQSKVERARCARATAEIKVCLLELILELKKETPKKDGENEQKPNS